jgi:hypothetical protein
MRWIVVAGRSTGRDGGLEGLQTVACPPQPRFNDLPRRAHHVGENTYMSRIAVWIMLTIAMVISNVAIAKPITCLIASKFSCDAGGGCKPLQPGIWNVIDLEKQTYSRCDIRGCDSFDVRVTRSGEFIVIDASGRGMVAKLASNFSSFLEIATIGTSAVNSFGSCE